MSNGGVQSPVHAEAVSLDEVDRSLQQLRSLSNALDDALAHREASRAADKAQPRIPDRTSPLTPADLAAPALVGSMIWQRQQQERQKAVLAQALQSQQPALVAWAHIAATGGDSGDDLQSTTLIGPVKDGSSAISQEQLHQLLRQKLQQQAGKPPPGATTGALPSGAGEQLLTRSLGRPGPVSSTVALTSAMLANSARLAHVTSNNARTLSLQKSPPPGFSTLPGQLQYSRLLGAAKAVRASDQTAFQQEMNGIDGEINAYVARYKFVLNVPEAAAYVQAAWRARGPRVLFARFSAIRSKHLLDRQAMCFLPLLAYARAQRWHGRWLLKRCFQEWRELGDLTTHLFAKALMRLKASIGDVKDLGSANMLWALCTEDGADPCHTTLHLGTLVANTLRRQMPHRTLKLYLNTWRAVTVAQLARHQAAAQRLQKMESKRLGEYLHLLFRFWFRYSIIMIAERLDIEPPIFRPHIPAWDAWLWEHQRSKELAARVGALHKGFRLRHCFDFWVFFARRNGRMRQAWVATASVNIEIMLRDGLNAFKANWKEQVYEKSVRRRAFVLWLRTARRNIQVRHIQNRVAQISNESVLRQAFRQLRDWRRMSMLLSAAGCVRLWSRRSLALGPMYAWMGERVHMWFTMAFYRWKAFTLGRMRLRCMLGVHQHRKFTWMLELCFKALRKHALLGRADRLSQAAALDAGLAASDASAPPSRSHSRRRNSAASHGGDNAMHSGVSSGSKPSSPREAVMGSKRLQASASGRALGAGGKGLHRASSRRRGGGEDSPRSSTAAAAAAELLSRKVDDPNSPSWAVFVSMGDFPMRCPLKPLLTRDEIFQQNEAALLPGQTQALIQAKIERLLVQLQECDGTYAGMLGGERRMLLEMQRSHPSTPMLRTYIDVQHPHSSVWHTSGAPDPLIWQRLVGLLSTATEHPDRPALADFANLPHAEEVLAMRQSMYKARMQPAPKVPPGGPYGPTSHQNRRASSMSNQDDDSPGGHGDGEQHDEDTAGVRELNSRGRSRGRESSQGRQRGNRLPALRRNSNSDLDPGSMPGKPWIHLTHPQQDIMLVHKLAEAEEMLETAIVSLMGLARKELRLFHEVLEMAAPSQHAMLGDQLLWLLSRAFNSDTLFMRANLVYRTNRDRVVTGALELAVKARAYHAQRPEFTLTYPDDHLDERWAEVMAHAEEGGVDLEEDDDQRRRQAALDRLNSPRGEASGNPAAASSMDPDPSRAGGGSKSGSGSDSDSQEAEALAAARAARKEARTVQSRKDAAAAAAAAKAAATKRVKGGVKASSRSQTAVNSSKSEQIRLEMLGGSASQAWRSGAVPASPATSGGTPPTTAAGTKPATPSSNLGQSPLGTHRSMNAAPNSQRSGIFNRRPGVHDAGNTSDRSRSPTSPTQRSRGPTSPLSRIGADTAGLGTTTPPTPGSTLATARGASSSQLGGFGGASLLPAGWPTPLGSAPGSARNALALPESALLAMGDGRPALLGQAAQYVEEYFLTPPAFLAGAWPPSQEASRLMAASVPSDTTLQSAVDRILASHFPRLMDMPAMPDIIYSTLGKPQRLDAVLSKHSLGSPRASMQNLTSLVSEASIAHRVSWVGGAGGVDGGSSGSNRASLAGEASAVRISRRESAVDLSAANPQSAAAAAAADLEDELSSVESSFTDRRMRTRLQGGLASQSRLNLASQSRLNLMSTVQVKDAPHGEPMLTVDEGTHGSLDGAAHDVSGQPAPDPSLYIATQDSQQNLLELEAMLQSSSQRLTLQSSSGSVQGSIHGPRPFGSVLAQASTTSLHASPGLSPCPQPECSLQGQAPLDQSLLSVEQLQDSANVEDEEPPGESRHARVVAGQSGVSILVPELDTSLDPRGMGNRKLAGAFIAFGLQATQDMDIGQDSDEEWDEHHPVAGSRHACIREPGASASGSDGSDGSQGSEAEQSDEEAVPYESVRRNRSIPFKVTAQQLNAFMGGNMKLRKGLLLSQTQNVIPDGPHRVPIPLPETETDVQPTDFYEHFDLSRFEGDPREPRLDDFDVSALLQAAGARQRPSTGERRAIGIAEAELLYAKTHVEEEVAVISPGRTRRSYSMRRGVVGSISSSKTTSPRRSPATNSPRRSPARSPQRSPRRALVERTSSAEPTAPAAAADLGGTAGAYGKAETGKRAVRHSSVTAAAVAAAAQAAAAVGRAQPAHEQPPHKRSASVTAGAAKVTTAVALPAAAAVTGDRSTTGAVLSAAASAATAPPPGTTVQGTSAQADPASKDGGLPAAAAPAGVLVRSFSPTCGLPEVEPSLVMSSPVGTQAPSPIPCLTATSTSPQPGLMLHTEGSAQASHLAVVASSQPPALQHPSAAPQRSSHSSSPFATLPPSHAPKHASATVERMPFLFARPSHAAAPSPDLQPQILMQLQQLQQQQSGVRTRKRGNLRGGGAGNVAAMTIPTLPAGSSLLPPVPPLPSSMQLQARNLVQGGPDGDDMSPAALACMDMAVVEELQALRSMWSSNPYSTRIAPAVQSSNTNVCGTSPTTAALSASLATLNTAPSAVMAEAAANDHLHALLATAAAEEWAEYEASAAQLADKFAFAINSTSMSSSTAEGSGMLSALGASSFSPAVPGTDSSGGNGMATGANAKTAADTVRSAAGLITASAIDPSTSRSASAMRQANHRAVAAAAAAAVTGDGSSPRSRGGSARRSTNTSLVPLVSASAGLSSILLGPRPGSRAGGPPPSRPGSRPGSAPASPQRLRQVLSVVDDHAASAVNPESVSGLNLSSYTPAMADLMSRLVVAPMATRYLFWRKVQSVASLRTQLSADRALSGQLSQLTWMAGFDAAVLAPPRTAAVAGEGAGPLPPPDAWNHIDGAAKRAAEAAVAAAARASSLNMFLTHAPGHAFDRVTTRPSLQPPSDGLEATRSITNLHAAAHHPQPHPLQPHAAAPSAHGALQPLTAANINHAAYQNIGGTATYSLVAGRAPWGALDASSTPHCLGGPDLVLNASAPLTARTAKLGSRPGTTGSMTPAAGALPPAAWPDTLFVNRSNSAGGTAVGGARDTAKLAGSGEQLSLQQQQPVPGPPAALLVSSFLLNTLQANSLTVRPGQQALPSLPLTLQPLRATAPDSFSIGTGTYSQCVQATLAAPPQLHIAAAGNLVRSNSCSTPGVPGAGASPVTGGCVTTTPVTSAGSPKRKRWTAARLSELVERRARVLAGELDDELGYFDADQDADEVDRLVEATIAVHRRILQRHAQMPGSDLHLPGRGRALGWGRPTPSDLRDGFQSTVDPFAQPPPRPAVSPQATLAVSTRGDVQMVLADAPVVAAVHSRAVTTAITPSQPIAPPPADVSGLPYHDSRPIPSEHPSWPATGTTLVVASVQSPEPMHLLHLPYPSGQQRPGRSKAPFGSHSPVAPTPLPAQQQRGNVIFGGPTPPQLLKGATSAAALPTAATAAAGSRLAAASVDVDSAKKTLVARQSDREVAASKRDASPVHSPVQKQAAQGVSPGASAFAVSGVSANPSHTFSSSPVPPRAGTGGSAGAGRPNSGGWPLSGPLDDGLMGWSMPNTPREPGIVVDSSKDHFPLPPGLRPI